VSSLGYFVDKFENNFSKYCNRKFGVTTSNGTSALHLALSALDIKKGDEVIIPALTFAAVANAVLYTGAKPVLVDIDKQTLNMDPNYIEKHITKMTKAIIVAHLYGHPADMDPLLTIAKKNKLYVIEDAAEAHGALYKNKICGSFGDISCFSFYGNKTITTGEGGMCMTDNKNLCKKMKLLRDHGMTINNKYWHNVVGFNYRLTNLQSALGCAQLERIKEFVKAKRKNASFYKKELADVPWIKPILEQSYATSSYWMFTVLIDKNFKYSRVEVIEKLKEKGIDSRIIFYPLNDMPPYKNKKNKFPISEDISYRGINLPSSTKLTKKDIVYICSTIKSL